MARLIGKQSLLETGRITRREWVRFMSHIEEGEECFCTSGISHKHWLWRHPYGNGYGYFSFHGKRYKSTHVSYIALRGPIPEGKELDHLCRVTQCANPWCVEPVTHKENILRGKSPAAKWAIRIFCGEGHPYNEENTSIKYDGSRRCNICHAAQEYGRRRRCGLVKDISNNGER